MFLWVSVVIFQFHMTGLHESYLRSIKKWNITSIKQDRFIGLFWTPLIVGSVVPHLVCWIWSFDLTDTLCYRLNSKWYYTSHGRIRKLFSGIINQVKSRVGKFSEEQWSLRLLARRKNAGLSHFHFGFPFRSRCSVQSLVWLKTWKN